ncbi:MAG: PadR family transcriptional regulator [Candidatus Altiarchaeum hamiconexum]|uniref:PadR family transcriptional regulator n=1 Tax=Candidatus Altarchaeum hamiconexum TaxID=1803513 RepID=A0A8J8CJP3_9ARCH|nr:PadR family transcriptional regulator [Candidatus Altarchaeum hamiconexum]OIQ05142.1 MAG: hypothetical protein AUK59_04910 [Candidatus Altarchaeum sp. CG2_30_32_3053]PIN67132.1 MAG: hypothetical protein COV98_04515 [Candidatus Altarchaeum sp. CG12_big_fil_rev_8_21_14_0_65_33_22]PIV27714.1 MAG: hypothetical protein COS36_04805 [Candidatus Altarchaeum sp. CG03_land_8_20_14_0_80_32_618]PIZ30464.1 MAG: hypothetical protein COY41_03955 [Candidatus Altarchaeum sp. CG_4_10_14_0_8_um_filter_32_851]
MKKPKDNKMSKNTKKDTKKDKEKYTDLTDEETLTAWVNEKFIRTFGKIYMLWLISKNHNHGYEILKFLKDNFSIDASAPLIYSTLDILEKEGFISGIWKHEDGKPDKKEYTITEKGAKLLEIARKKILGISQNMLKNENG